MNTTIPPHIADAFTAAGEAMREIKDSTGTRSITLICGEGGLSVMVEKASTKYEYIHGRGETIVDKLESALAQYEESRGEAAKLRTAKDAIAAVKGIVDETLDGEQREALSAKIDGLPVAP